MKLSTPAQAVARARRFTTYRTGQCLNYVCNVFTEGRGLGVYAPYALHAWRGAKYKHTDRNPPAGVPVYFSAGTKNSYGHVAISLGGGRIRSTDWPTGGPKGSTTRVGETTIAGLEKGWNRRYLGWAEDFYGTRIPGFPKPVKKPAPKKVPYPGHSYRRGSSGSTVKVIQRALVARGQKVSVDGSFGPKTEAAVKAFQRSKHFSVDGVVGPKTWAALAPTA